MPIPDFDFITNVLPPHLGDPRNIAGLSPYRCTTEEFVEKLAFSQPRVTILEGLLNLRAELRALGLDGFQWLDGSFLEDVETHANRAPGDIDVVTFIAKSKPVSQVEAIKAVRAALFQRALVKQAFRVDHFVVPLASEPGLLVELTRYWCGLFSHRKGDGIWKGMLRVELDLTADDRAARQVLGSKP